ncbi:MAG: hypothetical protein JJU29_11895 [Verrucomicrobia bacterium]|nr:hypothetical protein [Verrucomicrobiota bacterium]MCH8514148.1 hypothetical protein [Kiritimatiellia bacterium]
MKKIITGITYLLFACSIHAEQPFTTMEIDALREAIHQQETLLQAMKDRLRILEGNQAEAYRITINPDGIFYGDTEISEEHIQPGLAELPKDAKVEILADPEVPHGRLISLLDHLRRAELHNVVLISSDVDGASQEIPVVAPPQGRILSRAEELATPSETPQGLEGLKLTKGQAAMINLRMIQNQQTNRPDNLARYVESILREDQKAAFREAAQRQGVSE